MEIDYFIADLHFNDEKVAKERGFENSEQHDNHIIQLWNNNVEPSDQVFILGDISRGDKDAYKLLEKMHGKKVVVLGNWELKEGVVQLWNYVDSVCGSMEYENCILSHIPLEKSTIEKYDFCLHGHLHSHYLPDRKYINVSASLINYIPQTLEWLKQNNQPRWIKKTPSE